MATLAPPVPTPMMAIKVNLGLKVTPDDGTHVCMTFLHMLTSITKQSTHQLKSKGCLMETAPVLSCFSIAYHSLDSCSLEVITQAPAFEVHSAL